MEGLQHFIISTLNEAYNFRIIEYRDNIGRSHWGLHKPDYSSNEIILFLDPHVVKQDYQYMYNYIRSNYDGEKPAKVHLAFIDNYEDPSLVMKDIQHPYEVLNVLFDLVLIDRQSRKVLYYDESAYEIASLMQGVISIKEDLNTKRSRKEKSTITYVLIVLNILIFMLTAWISGNIFDIDVRTLIFFGAKYNELIDRGQYYRLFTAMFLHGGIIHIAFNMYALAALGPLVEKIYGKLKFLVIYILGGLASTLFSYIFSSGVAVGASGAIFALLGCTLVFGVKMRSTLRKGFISNIMQVIAVNLLLGFTVSNIDNYGHIGGLIGGILISLLLPLPEKNNDCQI